MLRSLNNFVQYNYILLIINLFYLTKQGEIISRFFLILSNKNKQHTDIQTLLFDKTRGNPEPFFTILKNKTIKAGITNPNNA